MKSLLKQNDSRYKLNLDKKVFVYRNLHKDCFSVRQDGLVKMHTTSLRLGFCTFKVNERGRQLVVAEQRKNVHAGVEGLLLGEEYLPSHPCDFLVQAAMFAGDFNAISYNPYKNKTFVKDVDGSPASSATAVFFDMDEGVIGYNVK